jgi:hypothetical protein
MKPEKIRGDISVSITSVFETVRKSVPATFPFLSYMEPLSPISRGGIEQTDSGKPDYRNTGQVAYFTFAGIVKHSYFQENRP